MYSSTLRVPWSWQNIVDEVAIRSRRSECSTPVEYDMFISKSTSRVWEKE